MLFQENLWRKLTAGVLFLVYAVRVDCLLEKSYLSLPVTQAIQDLAFLITEWGSLQEPSEDHLVQHPFYWMKFLKGPFIQPDFAHIQWWDIHSFSGESVQCLTSFLAKHFFPLFSLRLTSFSLKLLPLYSMV